MLKALVSPYKKLPTNSSMSNNLNGGDDKMSNKNLLTIVIVLLVGIFAVLILKEPEQPTMGDITNQLGESIEEVGDEIDDSI